jgi:hypothetical protein
LQIGSIDDGYRFAEAWNVGQQPLHQLIIDRPQTAHARPNPKFVQHPHVRRALPVTQVREASPLPLLRQ